MTGKAVILRGDARALPLPDESVDLVVTSPPYFSLRSYTDGGEHYEGQIGSETTPAEYLQALVDSTREWVRVLKPSGSLWVELGDKYANDARWGGVTGGKHVAGLHGSASKVGRTKTRTGMRPKSLMLLPERYRIACVDQLGLIARAVMIRHRVNGLPEPTTDRVRRAHDDWVHLVKQPRYFAAMDEIREPHTGGTHARRKDGALSPKEQATVDAGHRRGFLPEHTFNGLGRLAGSVWDVVREPFVAPAELGIEHFAAFPPSLVRRIILGWSPSGICVVCGEGRRPVVDRSGASGHDNNPASRDGKEWAQRMASPDRIVGYACACTPYVDHPERRRPSVTPSRALGRGHQDNEARAAVRASRHHGNDWPVRQPVREYDLDGWAPPPTRPAVVLDPFGGTGTTALVASVLGRIGISVDRSGDYCRLAEWRVNDPGERARAMRVPKPAPVHDDQLSLFA